MRNIECIRRFGRVVCAVGATILTACGDGGEKGSAAEGPSRNPSPVVFKEYFVSPEGSDTNSGTLEAPFGSLARARQEVRSHAAGMTGDIVVNLRGGDYFVPVPLAFSIWDGDSGMNGFNVIYRAYPGETPVLSGGRAVTGWTLYNSGLNIYRASVGIGTNSRQLYVNGVRAVRARSPLWPSGWTKTASGFEAPDGAMESWSNPSDLEIVSWTKWKSYRCGVASIVGRQVTMKQPAWRNCQLHAGASMDQVTWVENAYELIDEPGEWYLDGTAGDLYYKPRAGEDLGSAIVTLPVTEALLRFNGLTIDPVHNLRFEGLTLAYTTWMAPSGNEGYASLQAGIRFVGTGNEWSEGWFDVEKTPGAVHLRGARHVSFERNTFIHLGSAGLSMESGSQYIEVVGNVFRDISSNAVQVGSAEDFDQSDPNLQNTRNVVRNNFITQAGAEYHDAVGIWAGYVSYCQFEHNEIVDLPYSGISLGWGFGQDSYARENRIAYNRIVNTMQTLKDGGGIYTVSAQPGSMVQGNYISGTDRGLYHDEGSAYFVDRENVVEQGRNSWLNIWNEWIRDNDVQYNWHDTDNTVNAGTNNVVANNILVQDRQWPAGAAAVIESAGLEPAYRDLR